MKKVIIVTAKRDRLYHPEMYRAGDQLMVALVESMTGRWLVRAYNKEGQRVNGLVATSYKDVRYARQRALEFAATL